MRLCEFQRVPTQRVPTWRPELASQRVPNWRPELASRIGPVSARPELGVQRVPNELFIKVKVCGVGVGGGCIPARPDLGGPKQGIPARPEWGPFPWLLIRRGPGKSGFGGLWGFWCPWRVQIWQFLAIFSNLGDFASPGIPGNGGGPK